MESPSRLSSRRLGSKVLSPEDIATRLDDQFQLLTGGNRTALQRHQTLRAAVDWSYQLLTPAEQALLARLAVFAGSFSLEAVEAICSDDALPVEQVLDVLEHLVDRSLVDTETTPSGVRYRLLESIRQYGHERLAGSGDADTWWARHRDFFAEFAVQRPTRTVGTRTWTMAGDCRNGSREYPRRNRLEPRPR